MNSDISEDRRRLYSLAIWNVEHNILKEKHRPPASLLQIANEGNLKPERRVSLPFYVEFPFPIIESER
jgi:hypothetical protein